jgi:hypothetical protein
MAPRRFRVLDGATLILELVDQPGPIVSTAHPPPGAPLTQHPFLSASARSPHHEHRLGEILRAASSVDDFLARLRAAGFSVETV